MEWDGPLVSLHELPLEWDGRTPHHLGCAIRLIMGWPAGSITFWGTLEDRDCGLILPNLSKTSSRGGGKLLLPLSLSHARSSFASNCPLHCLPAACLSAAWAGERGEHVELRLNDRLRRRDEQRFPVAEITA